MPPPLTHWSPVTHICVGKLIIIGSDNGLSPDRRQAVIWTNAPLPPIGPLRTYFNENLIKIQQFSKKMHVKMLSAKWHPSCLGLNVLTVQHTELVLVSHNWRLINWVTFYHTYGLVQAENFISQTQSVINIISRNSCVNSLVQNQIW